MPSRREQVESIVRKWLVPNVHDKTLVALSNHVLSGLVDDLLALFPPPSREALENALTELDITINSHGCFRWVPASKWCEKCRAVLNRLMAWASPASEPPQLPHWCDHLFRSTNNEEYVFEDHTDNSICRTVSTKQWRACPICVAPRPTESPC